MFEEEELVGSQILVSADSFFTDQKFAIDYATVIYEQSTMQDVKSIKTRYSLVGS
jgi:hypothetical protein